MSSRNRLIALAAALAGMMQAGAGEGIDFEVDTGTNLSLDASGSGEWLVFDLLGHLYRVDGKGGPARVLTQSSGAALNITPAVSPDGRRIAFASDRSGQLNLWVMSAAGAAPVALTHDVQARFVDPTWAPDGRSIAVVRRSPVPGFGAGYPRTEIWSVPVDGSPSRPLVRPANDAGLPVEQFGAPSFSPDGKFLYFHRAVMSACMPGLKSSRYRLRRLDLASGDSVDVRPGVAPAASDCAAERLAKEQETEPRVSPDGRYLAFALTSPEYTMIHRDRQFRPGTALMVRDLASGEERRLASPITSPMTHGLQQWLEINPASISWSADSKRIFHTESGQIRAVDVSGERRQTVPFRARVQRSLAPQLRPKQSLDTRDEFSPALLQWPSTSPDGRSLILVAAGRLLVAHRGGSATPLLADAAVGERALLYTPAWSPSGDEVAFSSWDAASGGHVWRYSLRTGKLRQVTRLAGRYLYPAWSPDGMTLAYLYSSEPVSTSPQLYQSPFDNGVWQIMVTDAQGQSRKIAETERPHRIAFGMDGGLRHLTRHPTAGTLDLASVDPRSLERTIAMRVTPVPWYWPETSLSPDGERVALIVSNRAFVCEISRFGGPDRVLDISNAKAFDVCTRLDRGGAWFAGWRDSSTVEFTDGSSQLSVHVGRDERASWPITVSVQRPATIDLLIRNATLIPMTGGQATVKGDLLIVDRRIACVGECAPTATARVIDASGKFIIPGLIDTHDHTTRIPNDIVYPEEWKARASLAYGVTTRYDPFSRTRSLSPASDLIEAGRLAGPRTYGSGDVINSTIEMGGPVAYFDYDWPLRDTVAAASEVDWRARLGVPILKHYWSWSRAQGRMILDAARANGHIGVTSEALSVHQALAWVMDGQTMFEHTLAGLPIHQDVTRFLGQAGLVYTPTLIVEAAARFRADPTLFSTTGFESYAPAEVPRRIREMSSLFPAAQPQELASDIQLEAIKDLVKEGGRVSVGSHGEIPGLGTHVETWLLAAALGPLEALRAATVNGAFKLGLEAELGAIAAGQAADLIVLDGNPLEQIRNTARIHSVVRAGTLYPRDELVIRH